MIKIICIGKLKEYYLKEGINDYLKRINKYHKINIIELPDSNIDNEANEIVKHIDKMTNKELTKEETIKGFVKDEYTTKEKEFIGKKRKSCFPSVDF